MAKQYDIIVAGSCVADLLVRPVDLDQPIGHGVLYETPPQVITAGGITSNSGITLARLGLNVGVFSYVGNDAWGPVIRHLYQKEGVDDAPLAVYESGATSTTVVMIDRSGERSFYHCVGAPKLMDAQAFLSRMKLWQNTKLLLVGYYSLMPNLEPDLPRVFKAIREAGCMTAMDAAGTGGDMSPLDTILPYLDVWVPSRNEAEHQTGETDPEKMIARYRKCGAPGVIGIKLGGMNGIMLSDKPGEYVHVPSCDDPGEVLDTTGAGDSCYAGLVAGLVKGMSLYDAGRLGTAAAACCVTSIGGSTGGRSWDETVKIAGI